MTITNHTDSPSELRLLRMVKPLRLFKLLRIIRALKFTAVLGMCSESTAIISV